MCSSCLCAYNNITCGVKGHYTGYIDGIMSDSRPLIMIKLLSTAQFLNIWSCCFCRSCIFFVLFLSPKKPAVVCFAVCKGQVCSLRINLSFLSQRTFQTLKCRVNLDDKVFSNVSLFKSRVCCCKSNNVIYSLLPNGFLRHKQWPTDGSSVLSMAYS